MVYDPKNEAPYGGYVCGPVFQRVVRESLIAMNCPEDPVTVDAPVYEIRDGHVVKKTMTAKAEPPPLELGDPDLLEMPVEDLLAPLDGLELVSSEVDPNYTGPTLPNLYGLTKGQVQVQLAELGIDWDAHGAGWVGVAGSRAGHADSRRVHVPVDLFKCTDWNGR